MVKCNILGNNNNMKNGQTLNCANHMVLPTLSKQQFFNSVHVSYMSRVDRIFGTRNFSLFILHTRKFLIYFTLLKLVIWVRYPWSSYAKQHWSNYKITWVTYKQDLDQWDYHQGYLLCYEWSTRRTWELIQ